MLKKEEIKGGLDNQKKVMAYAGFDLCNLPYTYDDLFTEPSQKRLQETTVEYVPFLTYNNEVLDSLYAILKNSPTVSSIVEQKTAYSIGGGFTVVPSSKNELIPLISKLRATTQDIDLTAAEALNDWGKNVNDQSENLEDITKKIFKSLWSFGNAFLELSYIGNVFTMRILPIYLCRPRKAAKGDLYPTHIGVSEDWQDNYVTPENVVDYPIFPNFEEINEAQRSIVHFKFDSPNFYYWGAPDWISGKIWGEIEYRIAKYNQAKFENGFTPSAIVSLFGATNKEEATTLVKGLRDCFTGTGNNSKMFVQALRDESYKADVQILNNQEEGEFNALAELAQNELITAHRWSASLAGKATAGALGSNQQIRSEFDIVYSGVIRPAQDYVMRIMNKVIDEAGNVLGYDFSGIDLDLKKAMPVTFAGDIDVSSVMTINEQRKELGLEPLENLDNGNTDTN